MRIGMKEPTTGQTVKLGITSVFIREGLRLPRGLSGKVRVVEGQDVTVDWDGGITKVYGPGPLCDVHCPGGYYPFHPAN